MKLKLSKELQRAFDDVRFVIEERARAKGLVAAAQQRIQEIDRELETTFAAMASAEADAALQSGSPGLSVSPALATLRSLEDEKALLTARITGLQAKEVTLEDGFLERADSLISARLGFAKDKLSEFREEYLRAAQAFIEFARRGQAMSESLGLSFGSLKDIRIPDPNPPVRAMHLPDKLVSLLEQRYENGIWIEGLPKSPDIEALTTELGPLSQTCATVLREATQIRERRANEERARKQAQLDAQWEQGSRLSSTSLPVSSFALKAIEEQEAKDQKLREAFKVQHSTAVEFPNNPERL